DFPARPRARRRHADPRRTPGRLHARPRRGAPVWFAGGL
ncbi:MAG: hypothetical protein AVDCRST_MAG12-3204, partial [uncultured Rubrobacteraceae bacterium]